MIRRKFFLLACTASLLLCGCSTASLKDDSRLKLTVTIFPIYDWVKEIMGSAFEDADVTLLLDSGVDMHSYQPSAADIVTISESDLFVYVGGESDFWAEEAIEQNPNEDMTSVSLLNILGDAALDETEPDGSVSEGTAVKDEHVWLSIQNAILFCNSIADQLCTLDPQNADIYKNNLSVYIEKLKAMDSRYAEAIDSASVKTLVFADRFPFRYLADEYGLTCYAAFQGCSSETQASFKTVQFLSQKVDEYNLHAIMTIDKSDKKLAETVASETEAENQTILTLDSMQSISSNDISNGVTYLSILDSNLQVLIQALQ